MQYFDLRSVLDVFRRRFGLIIGVFAAVVLMTAIVVFSLTPKYTAVVLVMVDPSRKDLLDPNAMQGMSTAGDSARVDSEVEIVKSHSTMLRVVEDAKLLDEPDFQSSPGMVQGLVGRLGLGPVEAPSEEEALAAAVAKLMGAVSVRRRGLTYIIAISAEAANAATAARIANAFAAAYIEGQVQSKVAAVLGSLDLLTPRVAEAVQALAASENDFDSFIDAHRQDFADAGDRADSASLSALIAATAKEATDLNARLEAASASLASGDYTATASLLQSSELSRLAADQAIAGESLATLATDDAQVAGLQSEVDGLAQQFETLARQEMDSLRQRASSALQSASTLRDDFRQAVLAGPMTAETLTQVYQLQQASTLARANYERLLARVNDLGNQAEVQVADSRIVSPATPPSAPSFPNVRLLLALAGVLGLGLGATAALVADAYVGGFRSSEHLASAARRAVAASIPAQKAPRRPDGTMTGSVFDAVVTTPLSQFSERLRLLRLRVDEALASAPVGSAGARVVVVTSSVALEGKTTTAIALARTYDAAGAKVLLIDCDLRRPAISLLLGIDAQHGLIDYVSGRIEEGALASLMGRDPLSGVSVVVGLGQSEVPTEQMLAGDPFARLLAAARRTFDVVILDTPPIDLVVDGIYTMQHADVVLFVTRWGQTGQGLVLRSLDAADRAKRPGVPVLLALAQEPEHHAEQGMRGYFSYARP